MNIAIIKAAQLEARKARNSVKATLLTTLIGEAEMIGKSAGNRESTDAEVLQVIRKFEKNLNENIKLFTGNIGKLIALDYAEQELAILQEFLPQKISDEQVKQDIENVICQYQLAREQKSMGTVVKELKVKYGAQFDGQQVSAMFKQMV
jgi:uncharacterized protein YqeY